MIEGGGKTPDDLSPQDLAKHLPTVSDHVTLSEKADLSRARISWYFYDFGNTIIELVTGVYLTQWLIGDIGVSASTFGVAFAVSSLLSGITGPYIGSLADLHDLRRSLFTAFTLLTAAFVSTFSLLPSGWSSTPTLVLACGILGNYSFHLSGMLYNSALVRVSSGKTILYASSIGTGLSYLGGLVGLALVSLIVSGSILTSIKGPRFAFFPAGLLFLACALPALLARNLWGVIPPTTPELNSPHSWWRGPWQLVLQRRRVLLFLLSFLLLMAALAGQTLYLPLYLREKLPNSTIALPLLFTGGVVSAIVGSLLNTALGPPFSSFAVRSTAGILGWCLGVGILTIPENPLILLVMSTCLQGFFLGYLTPSLRAQFAHYFTEHRQGTAFGFFGLCQRLAAGLGAVLWPWLARLSTLTGLPHPEFPGMILLAITALLLFATAARNQVCAEDT